MDKLVELQMFQEECHILFKESHTDERENNKASLVLNMLGEQGSMTIKSLEFNNKEYSAVFEALEDTFRPVTL